MENFIEVRTAVFSNNWLGVSETFIFRQTEALDDINDKVVILTQNLKKSKILETDRSKKRMIYYQRMPRLSFYLGVLGRKIKWPGNRYASSVKQRTYWGKAIRSNRINLIHAHYGYGGLTVLSLAKKANLPLITTFHGNDASGMLKKDVYVSSLKLLFNYSYIITVSEFIKRRLLTLGAKEDRIICHYIGTDLSKFTYVDHISIKEKVRNNEQLQFLQVSNFVEKKGHRYTLQAFRKFLDVYPNALLIFGGEGVTRPECEELVKELAITDRVQFLGAIGPDKVSELMKQSDIFLHHSITGIDGSEEGIPTVLMEAMASGIPVVSTNHAGIPELVTHGKSGFLVEEKNINEYFGVLKSILEIDTQAIAENARNHVYDKFDLRKQNKKLLLLYQRVIKGAKLN